MGIQDLDLTIELTEEQRSLQQMLGGFVEDEVVPIIHDIRARSKAPTPHSPPPPEITAKMSELKLNQIMVPERYGGISYDVQTLTAMSEAMSRRSGGTTGASQAIWMRNKHLAEHAPQHLQDTWFPRIMEDPSFTVVNAMTEPQGASNRALMYNAPGSGLHTRAVQQDGHWVINGQKQFISGVSTGDLFIIYVNTNPDVGICDGTTSFLIPKDTPGMTPGTTPGDIYFDDCRVPDDQVIVRDKAIPVVEKYFTFSKPMISAGLLGAGQAAYDQTVEFCKTRVQGGCPIIRHQLVGASLVEMATKLASVRLMVYAAARALDEETPDSHIVAQMAHLHSSVMVFEVVRRALELWGGMGTDPNTDIWNIYRRASIGLHLDGTTDIHKLKIAKMLFPDDAGSYGAEQES